MMTTTRVSSSFCIVVFLVFISTSSLCFPRTTSAFGMTTTTATVVPAVVSKRRDLPEKIIVGYTTRCSDQVVDAVRNGVNVVIWSFVELVLPDSNDAQEQVQCVAHFNLDCVKRMIQRLDLEGYTDTVHLVSFGKIFQMRDFFGCGFYLCIRINIFLNYCCCCCCCNNYKQKVVGMDHTYQIMFTQRQMICIMHLLKHVVIYFTGK